jgi:AcrR family transcriptional regulator
MDSDERYIPRFGPMFSGSSPAKAEMATDLAIPLLAEGGWSAVTLRTVARAANVTPQAIAAWFPSVNAMRVAIAGRYGERWIRERSSVAYRRLAGLPRPDAGSAARSQVVHALLPETWLEEVFDGVWLTVVEAARWDETIGSAVGDVRARERDLVADLLDDRMRDLVVDADDPGKPGGWRSDDHVDIVLAVIRGLRVARTSPHGGMSAERAADLLGTSPQRREVTSASAGRTSAM